VATTTAPAVATTTAPAAVTTTAPAVVTTTTTAPTVTAPVTAATATTTARSFNEIIEDLPPDVAAEFIGMRGEYLTWFAYTYLISFKLGLWLCTNNSEIKVLWLVAPAQVIESNVPQMLETFGKR
jgi:hypothetical protein